MKVPTSLEETVQLPVTVVPAAEPETDPLVDTAVQGELVLEPGAHRQASRLGKRTRVMLGAAGAFALLSVAGVVVFGSGGSSEEPAAGPVAPPVVASPTSSSAEPTPSAATETLAVPTTKPVASAQVRAEGQTTAVPPPTSKQTVTSESVDPRSAALSSIMREIEKEYGKPSRSRP
jgi:hypothetical protein